MTDDLLGAVSRILAEYDDPYLERPISDYLQSVDLSDRQLTVRLVFPYPCLAWSLDWRAISNRPWRKWPARPGHESESRTTFRPRIFPTKLRSRE